VSADLVRAFEGKKFLWDGVVYETRPEAEARAEAYRAEGFEVQVVEQDGKASVYTRRVVKQAAAA
jgi:hypothetical protein